MKFAEGKLLAILLISFLFGTSNAASFATKRRQPLNAIYCRSFHVFLKDIQEQVSNIQKFSDDTQQLAVRVEKAEQVSVAMNARISHILDESFYGVSPFAKQFWGECTYRNGPLEQFEGVDVIDLINLLIPSQEQINKFMKARTWSLSLNRRRSRVVQLLFTDYVPRVLDFVDKLTHIRMFQYNPDSLYKSKVNPQLQSRMLGQVQMTTWSEKQEVISKAIIYTEKETQQFFASILAEWPQERNVVEKVYRWF